MDQIANGIYYIGVNDHELDLFEGQYIVPNGMAYNSYVIMDEKVAVMDSVDANFGDEWIAKLEAVLDGRTPDYLIVQHMEPDHSANITTFTERYPQAVVVGSMGAFNMMQNYFGTKFEGRNLVVKEGDTLSLGSHELSFIAAPNVHWPEVIFTYDASTKVLFSADAFGKFGALDVDEDWDCEARRYYFGIVGKFGPFVQKVLAKAAKLDIEVIAPLHGPVLSENLEHYLGQYSTWAAYGVETPGVVIAYTSVYGHTKEAVELLEAKLREKGCPRVVVTPARGRHRPGPRRPGRGRGGRVPPRAPGARHHHLLRRLLPGDARVHQPLAGPRVPRPHRGVRGERFVDARRHQGHARAHGAVQRHHVRRAQRDDRRVSSDDEGKFR